MLKRQIAVHTYQYVEFLRRQREELSVLDARPAQLVRSFHVMTRDVACQTPIHALVKEYSHVEAATSWSFASSRKAITCSRLTEGNLLAFQIEQRLQTVAVEAEALRSDLPNLIADQFPWDFKEDLGKVLSWEASVAREKLSARREDWPEVS